ncbi:MAG: hypothetical protein V2I46_01665 [Bacteroides sp.]|jgi:hypothetical protein|nr:hypothetical protein [Bacteroides sp.]
MKTKKTFRQGVFFLALTVLFLPGCATLDKAALSELQRVPFEPLALQPSFDVYQIRLDLIRETDRAVLPDSTVTEEEESYRTLGFYLGNGLFYDLNKNLSLLIPDLFQVDPAASFTIQETDRRNFRNVIYRRDAETYQIEYLGLIPWVRTANLLITDTTLTFERGLLNKYTLSWTDSTLRHKGLIFSTRILPEPGGFYVPGLFFRRHFSQSGNLIELDREYRIVEENNAILFFKRNMLGRDKLQFTMVRSHSDWYIYNKRKRGLRISFRGNEVIVFENQREIKRYLMH